MDRESAWDCFIDGFTGTAYARRVATRFQAGPLEAVRFADDDRPLERFDEFFVRACAPATALAAVVSAQPVAEHYLTVLDDRPGLVAAYVDAGYRLSHSEALMVLDLAARTPEQPSFDSFDIMVANTADDAAWLNANDPQGLAWIVPDNLTDDRMVHYAVIADGRPVARGCNLRLDAVRSYVSRVYTDQGYRRRGLAQAVMQRLLAEDRDRGGAWSVLTASGMGEGLYAGLGYRAIGTIFIFEPA